jgi:NAD(P)-dependent dehydrogenase (short-subunit alcohol dehydrogenase family)
MTVTLVTGATRGIGHAAQRAATMTGAEVHSDCQSRGRVVSLTDNDISHSEMIR